MKKYRIYIIIFGSIILLATIGTIAMVNVAKKRAFINEWQDNSARNAMKDLEKSTEDFAAFSDSINDVLKKGK